MFSADWGGNSGRKWTKRDCWRASTRASPGRTPAGFTVNSRGWGEGRATPPDSRRRAPEPRRGSPGTKPSQGSGGWDPPRWGGGPCGNAFRGCARASRTHGYSPTTPPGLGRNPLLVPQGRLKEQPGARPFNRPSGTWFSSRWFPALKRRAIFKRPCGTIHHQDSSPTPWGEHPMARRR